MELNLFHMFDQKQKLFQMEQLNSQSGGLMDQVQTKLKELVRIVFWILFLYAQIQLEVEIIF